MILVNQFKKVAWRDGITVADVLGELGWDYALITTTVNGVFVPTEDYNNFQVPDEADMRAIHIAHGG